MKKLFTLLTLLVAIVTGAWASTGIERATNTGASNTQITGKSYTIAGTYIAGAGAGMATGMSNKGVKFRTNQNQNTLVFTVNEGYTITAFKFYGVSNYALATGKSEPCIAVTNVTVDGVAATSTGTNNFPAKGASNAGSVILENISATQSIVMTFDNSNSSGNQVNGYYEITWTKPTVAVPVGQANTPALDPLQYETINLTDAYSFDSNTKTLVVSANKIRSGSNQNWMTFENANEAKKTWNATGVFKGSSFYNTGDNNNAVVLTQGKSYSLTVTNCNTISAFVLSGGSNKTSITISMNVYEMDVDGDSKLSEDPVQTKSTNSTSVATLTATDLNPSKIYRATFTSTHATSNSYVYEVAFSAPQTTAEVPTFTPDGGDVDGGTAITLGSDAAHTYYQWSDTEVTLTKDSEGWTEGKSVTVPNVTSTKYLYAYATNGSGLESDVVSKAFNITKVKLANGLVYATDAVTKKVGYAAFTNPLTNPNNLTITYSIAEGATATGTTVNAETGEVTLGENAGTATIKATFAGDEEYLAGEASYTLTLNPATVQTDVSSAKTWDIENHVSCDGDRNTDNTYMLYADIEGLSLNSAFDGTSLMVKASSSNTAYRKQYKCAQGASLKFHTTVPGTVDVTFSSPSSEARTLQVNGKDVASSTAKTTASAQVAAGEIEIKGKTSIRIFKIVFTPAESLSTTITDAGWATLYTPWPLDFAKASPSGLTAYTATLSNNTVTLTEVQNVQAGTGVVLKGDAGNYTIPVAENSSTAKGDMIGNAIAGTELAAETAYILNINGAGKAQFFINNAGTIAAGKAYLPVGTNHAKALSVVFADDMTGITNANAAEEAAQPAKRIVNGQLVIEKNGKRYNAAGAEF